MLGLLEQRGPVIVTHQGLSGPAVLRLSAYGAQVLAKLNYQADVEVNWIPAVSMAELCDHLMLQKSINPNKYASTIRLDL